VCSLTLQEFCAVDSTVHLVHLVWYGVSCCMKYGTSSHFPLYSFHVTDSIYYVWEDVCYFEIPVYVLVMCCVSNPVSFFYGTTAPSGSGPPCHQCFMMTLRHTTLIRTLDEWSAQCRDIYLTTHNTHKRLTSMPAAGFKPANLASEWPHTHASDSAVTGITPLSFMCFKWYP